MLVERDEVDVPVCEFCVVPMVWFHTMLVPSKTGRSRIVVSFSCPNCNNIVTKDTRFKT